MCTIYQYYIISKLDVLLVIHYLSELKSLTINAKIRSSLKFLLVQYLDSSQCMLCFCHFFILTALYVLQVATFILQKILLDELGLSYICQTYERFSHVAMILVSISSSGFFFVFPQIRVIGVSHCPLLQHYKET